MEGDEEVIRRETGKDRCYVMHRCVNEAGKYRIMIMMRSKQRMMIMIKKVYRIMIVIRGR